MTFKTFVFPAIDDHIVHNIDMPPLVTSVG